jgi:hypothetical protein
LAATVVDGAVIAMAEVAEAVVRHRAGVTGIGRPGGRERMRGAHDMIVRRKKRVANRIDDNRVEEMQAGKVHDHKNAVKRG